MGSKSIAFEDAQVPLNLTGSKDLNNPFRDPPNRPWAYDNLKFCLGVRGLTAGGIGGDNKGVESESILNVLVPPGAASMTFFYSHPARQAGKLIDFQVIVNGDQPVREYGKVPGNAASCELDRVQVSGGDVVKFRCAIKEDKQTCSIDHIEFYLAGDIPCDIAPSDSPSISPSDSPSITNAPSNLPSNVCSIPACCDQKNVA